MPSPAAQGCTGPTVALPNGPTLCPSNGVTSHVQVWPPCVTEDGNVARVLVVGAEPRSHEYV